MHIRVIIGSQSICFLPAIKTKYRRVRMVSKDIREFTTNQSIVVLATVSTEGAPNVAPMAWKVWYDDTTLLILDNYMNATRANVQNTGKASVSAWNAESDTAYQLKGTAEYANRGPYMEKGIDHMSSKKPGASPRGVVVLHVQAVYSQKPGDQAGELITATRST